MSRPTLIAPSILSADFSKLGAEVACVDAAGADWIHLDVMDGHFVPNITFGPGTIQSIRSSSAKLFDCHLMIAPADPYIQAFADAGADLITVHAEACPHLDRTIQSIKALGKKAGVSLNPATSERVLDYVIDQLDLVLVMTVNPGFGGQSFLPSQLEKIKRIAAMIGNRSTHIQVDGGVNIKTARSVIEAGADVLVAGSAVFKGGEPGNRTHELKANIEALRAAAAPSINV